MGVSRATLDMARVAGAQATLVEGGVSGSAPESRSPATPRTHVASGGDVPGVPALDAAVTSASHGPAALGSLTTTFMPLLRPNLLLRTASPTVFRSSPQEPGAFSASGMAAVPTSYGAHDLALTIIGRTSSAGVETTGPLDRWCPAGSSSGATPSTASHRW